jgi:hypothetical protein
MRSGGLDERSTVWRSEGLMVVVVRIHTLPSKVSNPSRLPKDLVAADGLFDSGLLLRCFRCPLRQGSCKMR